jgi:hypothetical protein
MKKYAVVLALLLGVFSAKPAVNIYLGDATNSSSIIIMGRDTYLERNQKLHSTDEKIALDIQDGTHYLNIKNPAPGYGHKTTILVRLEKSPHDLRIWTTPQDATVSQNNTATEGDETEIEIYNLSLAPGTTDIYLDFTFQTNPTDSSLYVAITGRMPDPNKAWMKKR